MLLFVLIVTGVVGCAAPSTEGPSGHPEIATGTVQLGTSPSPRALTHSAATSGTPPMLQPTDRDPTKLRGGSDGSWIFAVPPRDAKPRLTSIQALDSAQKSGVRGDAFTSDHPTVVELVDLTIPNLSNQPSPYSFTDRLVYIVQVTEVSTGYSSPSMTTKPLTTLSTVQWVIGPDDGSYLRARDFN